MKTASYRKPRLLAVATTSPWPVVDGYSLRVYHLLRCMARDWDVTLVAPQSEESDGVFPGAEGNVDWVEMPWDDEWGYLPSQFDAAELRRRVDTAVKTAPPDATLVWSGTEYLVPEIGLPATVLDKVDCAALTRWRAARTAVGLRAKLRAVRAAWEYLWYERTAVRSTRFAVVVGPDDAGVLRRISGRDTVRVVPNGVVTGKPPDPADESDGPSVIFTGVLGYAPNVEAVTWFAERVWPSVRAQVPTARFIAAGRSPVEEVRRLDGRDGIRVEADVPDLAALLRTAWVGVAPMRSGSGIKNKVLEAWAEGKPVAMTRLAANGLQMDAQQSTLVVAGAGELAARIVELLGDDDARHRLGRAAWETAKSRHGWPAAADAVTSLLREAMEAA